MINLAKGNYHVFIVDAPVKDICSDSLYKLHGYLRVALCWEMEHLHKSKSMLVSKCKLF
jgi:hypothetical protein